MPETKYALSDKTRAQLDVLKRQNEDMLADLGSVELQATMQKAMITAKLMEVDKAFKDLVKNELIKHDVDAEDPNTMVRVEGDSVVVTTPDVPEAPATEPEPTPSKPGLKLV